MIFYYEVILDFENFINSCFLKVPEFKIQKSQRFRDFKGDTFAGPNHGDAPQQGTVVPNFGGGGSLVLPINGGSFQYTFIIIILNA